VAEILRAASAEMAEAAAWYESRVDRLGERFLREAEAAFARVDEKPLTGSPWKHGRLPDGVRRMFLRSFPYSVIYILEPSVVIVAVAHARRRPGYWVKRLDEIAHER
jgi:plasmid stabilization system protein ParE